MTSRTWLFTAFIEPNIPEDDERIKYCVYQEEECPDTKKIHWQGYVEFDSPIRIGQVKEILGDNTLHLERRRGTREQAIAYCTKQETRVTPPLTFGDINWREQGKRTDLDNVVDDIKQGMNIVDVALNNPKAFIKFHKGIEKLSQLYKMPKNEEKQVYCLIGAPGTGKTRYVYDNHPMSDIYRKPPGGWWDGYYGQPVVLIDDLDTNQYTISEMLQWLDRYPINVPVKGAFVPLECKLIYITSNKNIVEWFMGISADHIKALERRITKVIRLPPVSGTEQKA